MIDVFNTVVSGLLALIAGIAVMSPRVRCGLVAHIGLVLVSVGFLGVTLMSVQPYVILDAIAAANALVHLGLVLIAIEYILRFRRRGHQRRAGDWVERRAGRSQ